MAATSAKTRAAATAVVTNAVAAEVVAASHGKTIKAMPMPMGQLLTSSAKAVPISRPTNQSVVILVKRTLSRTAPMPLIRRPMKKAP
jgi:hypothetical protein